MSSRLLIIESEKTVKSEIKRSFESLGWKVMTCENFIEADHLICKDEFNPHVVLANVGHPNQQTLEQIKKLQEHAENSQWIAALDSDADSDDEEIEELTYDIVEKPYDLKRLKSLAKRALRTGMTLRLANNFTKQSRENYQVENFYGTSEPALQLKSLLKKFCDIPVSTLVITGETGTGKGLVARIVHHTGLRSNGPLIELNCAALPKDLLESQLFGHEAGAFTGAAKRLKGLFEQADHGTIFLDEIGDMDIELQSKLLKAIEDQTIRRLGSEKEIPIDVQVIAATSVNLEEAINEGKFREDLYHRISVFSVHLPSLSERKNDLVELVPRIIAEFNQKANRRVNVISDRAWEKLLGYDWPGNVRELRNVLERCVLLASDENLPDEWLQLGREKTSTHPALNEASLVIPLDGSMALEDVEKAMLEKALVLEDGNVTAAARRLQVSRETMRYRMKKFELV
ncbi:MAG: sigma-54-dependent Fis family transcriptional regulator [Gammaproteobacteria bacterium]|nr:sigma-54-dependent Fis family transcriptional regulator [Gammaproteobacteria bacterium]